MKDRKQAEPHKALAHTDAIPSLLDKLQTRLRRWTGKRLSTAEPLYTISLPLPHAEILPGLSLSCILLVVIEMEATQLISLAVDLCFVCLCVTNSL